MKQNLPDKSIFKNKRIPFKNTIELVEFIGSGCDGHVFRGFDHKMKRDFACKITPRTNLVGVADGTEAWRDEIEKANRLPPGIVVHFSDMDKWVDDELGIDCVVLIADYIKGKNLKQFLEQNKAEITIPFITSFLEAMFDLLLSMEEAEQRGGEKICHGDLHAGNVLVEDKRSLLRGRGYEFRVTDFGVAEATSTAARFKDDFFQVADILRQLLENFDEKAAEPRDQFIFEILNNEFLARNLVESDLTRNVLARSPRKLFERLRELDDEYEQFVNSPDTRLITPFDFLSCEQMGDAPGLLKALYSNLFLGLNDIESRNNVVVTGPRGCGKSTVFRNLSLRQRIRIDDALPQDIDHIGVYYFCNDLYFTFPRYQPPSQMAGIDIPIHFLTATLLSVLIEDITRWGQKFFQEEFERSEPRASEKLRNILGLNQKQTTSHELKTLVADLGHERRWAIFQQRNSHKDMGELALWGVNVFFSACEALRLTFPFLRNRPFYFYIDDYSSPKVTKDLQMSLNRLLMQRSESCFFKLATESPVSFIPSDIDGKQYVENREFSLVNLGQIYLRDETGRKLKFIDDVFRRRLETANYVITDLGALVGSDPKQNFNEDARTIRQESSLKLWSKETLSNLCSGDIHYVINLVRTMCTAPDMEACIKNGDSSPLIPIAVQDKCIRLEAGRFLNSLRASSADGEKLMAIVNTFGKIANHYIKTRNSKNQETQTPWQASRIEPYEQLKLSDDSQRIYNELLRYSVFIEDQRGKSRRGDVVPRLFLRRFLIPHFNLTFSTRDSIQVEPIHFELWLTKPREFERKFRKDPPAEDGPVLNLE